MNQKTNSRKECFGILDRVFPMGEEGLREVVPSCIECPDKKACLQAALNTREGLLLRNDVLDRAAQSGLVGRFRRWSEKKALSRRMSQRGGSER